MTIGRDEFPVTAECVYFDHTGATPA